MQISQVCWMGGMLGITTAPTMAPTVSPTIATESSGSSIKFTTTIAAWAFAGSY